MILKTLLFKNIKILCLTNVRAASNGIRLLNPARQVFKLFTMIRISIILLLIFTLTGCYEKNTENALKTYRYWAGTKPPDDLELIEGKYWQSDHWTKEYIMYLKIKPTEVWWNEFSKQNNLSVDTGDWTMPGDAPNWFKPTENSVRYDGGDKFNQSRFFRDNQTGICYIYAIQL
jgi:hypothetical protein